MIAIKDLSVAIGNFRLERITTTIEKGEYVVLLGPSGAGKTVLLEIIAGIRLPDNGSVFINGNDMAGVLPEHRGIALVYQDYSLFPHLTVSENIAYGMKMQNADPDAIARKVESLLAGFYLSAIAARYPGTLSGGEQQRVALARALATNPAVLLLDEPFASLDPNKRDECIRLMQDLKASRDMTVLQVSHSVDEAYALADRTIVLIGGKIAQEGRTDEIFWYPASEDVARFVGMENIITGRVLSSEAGHSRFAFGEGEISIPGEYPKEAALTIGIPATSIRIIANGPVPDSHGINVIEAKIARVISGRDTFSLELDSYGPLISTTQRSNERMDILQPGNRVFAVFRETDVRILKGEVKE